MPSHFSYHAGHVNISVTILDIEMKLSMHLDEKKRCPILDMHCCATTKNIQGRGLFSNMSSSQPLFFYAWPALSDARPAGSKFVGCPARPAAKFTAGTPACQELEECQLMILCTILIIKLHTVAIVDLTTTLLS